MVAATRRWILAAFAVLLVTAIVVWFACSRTGSSIPQNFLLPDGSMLKLEAITYGKTHLPRVPAWQRLLMKLPAGLRRRFSFANLAPHVTSEPQLIAWFSQPPNSTISFDVSIDDGGENWAYSRDKSYYSPVAGVKLEGTFFRAFPRRSGMLTVAVRVWNNGARQTIGSVIIPNPARSRVAPWPGGAPPVSATNNELVMTLTQVLAGVEFQDQKPTRAPGPEGAMRLGYSMTQQGRPTVDWKILAIEMQDATGNDAWVNSWLSSSDLARRGLFIGQPSFWPNETWKLKIDVARRTNFPPDQLIAVPGLKPVPGYPWGSQGWSNSAAIVRVPWGSNAVEVAAVVSGMDLRVLFRMPGLANDMQLDIYKASNRSDKEISSMSSEINGSTRGFGFRLDKDSMSFTNAFDVTFLITPKRRFEFFVRPERPPSNSAPASPLH